MQNAFKNNFPSPVCFTLLISSLLTTELNATTFVWSYGGERLILDYSFNTDDYNYYKGKSKFEQNMSVYAEQDKGHSYLASFAGELRRTARQHGWYGSSERDMVIRFVQQAIPYRTDPPNHGYDYPRYPIETLYEKKGDCEDKSCLMTALLKTLGHDAVLLEFKDHMAAGVAGDDIRGSAYMLNGKKYYYTETTSTFEPGNNPGYKTALVKTVRQTAFASKNPAAIANNTILKPELRKTPVAKPEQQTQYTNASGKSVIAYATQQWYVVKSTVKKGKTKTYKRVTYVVVK